MKQIHLVLYRMQVNMLYSVDCLCTNSYVYIRLLYNVVCFQHFAFARVSAIGFVHVMVLYQQCTALYMWHPFYEREVLVNTNEVTQVQYFRRQSEENCIDGHTHRVLLTFLRLSVHNIKWCFVGQSSSMEEML